MATLYYDGHCPLCAKEINFLRDVQRGNLQFEDVHSMTEYTEETRTRMLKVLHFRSDEGDWYTGPDATVQAWSYTRYGWMFKPLRWPLLGKIVDVVYNAWAKRRYYRLYECGKCQKINP